MANSYDPGPCKNETHGKYVLVKNRADEEKVVICVKDKEVYQWKSMDGKIYISYYIFKLYLTSFVYHWSKCPFNLEAKSSIPALRMC